MKVDTGKLSKVLYTMRDEFGLTWDQFAGHLNISRRTLYNWARGIGEPNKAAVERVLNLLEKPMHSVMPSASISIKHMLEPMDFTRLSRQYKQLRKQNRPVLATTFALHVAIKIGLFAQSRFLTLLGDGIPPNVQVVTQYDPYGNHRAKVVVKFLAQNVRCSINLEPDPQRPLLNCTLRRQHDTAGGDIFLDTGVLSETEVLRMVDYIAKLAGLSLRRKKAK